MPTKFEGEPTEEVLNDKRLILSDKDEPRLLEIASESGIPENKIGAFAVIVVVGVPIKTEIESGKFEWAVFDERELLAEIAKAPDRMFYDKDNQRLVAIAPPRPPLPKKVEVSPED